MIAWKNYMFLYKDIEFSHIFSVNIVNFVIKMLPLVASEVRKYSLHTCEIHMGRLHLVLKYVQ